MGDPKVIIKIHGTSGSGKTTAVQELMASAQYCDPIIADGAKNPEAYRLQFDEISEPIFVLGSYENACGGMDTVSSVTEQVALIHKYAEVGHVVYEGLLLSTYYGSLGKAVERYSTDHVWAFLDTPIDECIARVITRRMKANNLKPLNERNTRERIKPINSLKAKVTRMGYPVVTLDHTRSTGDQLYQLIWENERA